MDAGVAALIVGLFAVAGIAKVRPDWLKAAGGLLIALTVLFIVIDGLKLLGR